MCRPFIILIGFALFFGPGCTTSRDLNPGADVLWTVTNWSALQSDVKAVGLNEQVDGVKIENDKTTHIYVWSKAARSTSLHEFCHLIDQFGGNPEIALAVLTPSSGIPPMFQPTFDHLKAFTAKLKPGGSLPHWRQLENDYGRDAVQHSVVLRILDKEGKNPPPAPPPAGLATMSLDD